MDRPLIQKTYVLHRSESKTIEVLLKVFCDENFYPESAISSVLLNQDLLHQEQKESLVLDHKGIRRYGRFTRKGLALWNQVRKEFLDEQQEKFGKLICRFCKREVFADSKKLNFLATIDHIIPTSRGGSVFDKKNFSIACHTCNNRKGNKIASDI